MRVGYRIDGVYVLTRIVSSITDDGFALSLLGSLTGTGPLDAYIQFPEPLTVTFQGHAIATISLPALCAAANNGIPNLATIGQLTITDQGGYATLIIQSIATLTNHP